MFSLSTNSFSFSPLQFKFSKSLVLSFTAFSIFASVVLLSAAWLSKSFILLSSSFNSPFATPSLKLAAFSSVAACCKRVLASASWPM